jgi:Peptidase M60, enhancin and enhancin-like/N-terminal domain of M60-like peptidases
MHRTPSIFIALLGIISPALSAEDARTFLLGDISLLPKTGTPGGVSVIGPNAFALIAGKEGKALSPVAAVTTLEKGRVVAFGHNGYLGMTTDPDVSKLLANAVRWTSNEADKVKVGVRTNNALAEYLISEGFDVTRLEGIDWLTRTGDLSVICIDAHHLRGDAEVSALSKFVRSGGGLVIAATGWGWASLNPGKALNADFPGNQLLIPAGLAFNGRTPERTDSGGYTINSASLEFLNATRALEALAAHEANESQLDESALAQAGATVSLALQSLPDDDKTFLPRIAELAKKVGGFTHPTPKAPLSSDQAVARLLTAYTVEKLKRAKPEQLRAHPAALEFPGLVPGDALIENRELTIDTAVPGWHSTGLYAAPGASIRVTVPVDQVGKGYRVRIGCHTDSLWHHERWSRVPEITISTKIEEMDTRTANAFGGLVYIEVPEKTQGFNLQCTIQGAVGAPLFVLGKTTSAEWLKLRTKPAPWAELECGRVILTVPSEHVRQLDDPTQLAKFWDEVVRLEDELAGTAHLRKRPERIVADVQISAGYMHSGYPIMTHLDVAGHVTNFARMQAGSWGHFHELGHNHQSRDWTFDGAGEVTCNIFSFYVMEKLCGKPPGQGHGAMEPVKVAHRLAQHLHGDAAQKWDRWKSDPFLALTMYHQLRMGFGWEAYSKVFAEYRDLPYAERPKTDQEKRDQWMVRFSRTVGRNLGPFFEAWGIPVTEGALEQIKSLPAWMPDDWPKV